MCIIGSTVMSAQNKGDMYISGSISMSGSSSKVALNSTSVKEPGGFMMSIAPQFGYFIIDNLELHLGLGYSFQKEPDDDKSSTNTSLFVINPGVNYYLPIVENKFFRAGDLTYSLMQYKQTVGDETMKVSNNNFNFGLNLSTSLGFRYYF